MPRTLEVEWIQASRESLDVNGDRRHRPAGLDFIVAGPPGVDGRGSKNGFADVQIDRLIGDLDGAVTAAWIGFLVDVVVLRQLCGDGSGDEVLGVIRHHEILEDVDEAPRGVVAEGCVAQHVIERVDPVGGGSTHLVLNPEIAHGVRSPLWFGRDRAELLHDLRPKEGGSVGLLLQADLGSAEKGDALGFIG